MSPENAPGPTRAQRPQRPRWALLGERAIEATIRLSGVSAILFVAAIFFFVLREAAPVLFREEFSLGQFLFSTEWYPTSASNVRYGTLALTVGTLSVTGLAMLLEHGYHDLGIQALLVATGTPKGSFYHHFEDKEDFALQVIDRYMQGVHAGLDACLGDAGRPPLDRIRRFFEMTACAASRMVWVER